MALKQPDSAKKKSRKPKGSVGIQPDDFKVRPATPQKTRPATKTHLPPPPPPPPKKKERSWSGWLFSSLLRVSLLYSLYVYIWTCPKDGSDSRTICDFGDRTLDFIEPYAYDAYDYYIEPYYVEYLSPYVDKVSPYVISANENYIRPARVIAVDQFERNVRPQLYKAKDETVVIFGPYAEVVKEKALVLYDAYLADFVKTGQEVYGAYAPTVEKYSKQTYDLVLDVAYPYYVLALPYVEKALKQGIETAGWAGVEGKGWVARRWGMHVEPQLWRIQDRLGLKGFRGATPVKDDSPTPPIRGNPNASDTTPENTLEEAYEDDDSEDVPEEEQQNMNGEKPQEKKKSSAEQIEAARPLVEADLVSWGAKFEEAAIKAQNEVVSKLDELCGRVMKENSPLSTDILADLDAKVEKELKYFEESIQKLMDSPAEKKYVMMGYEGMVGSTFSVLKEKQDQIKGRTQEFLMDTYQNTAKIVDAALAEMDSAHDLGMQELGMKWAWMDGVTYKDWAKYHELKQDFGSWKTKVIRSGQGHKGLREVTDYAKSIDDAAAEVLKVARAEISKLVGVGRERLEKYVDERDAVDGAATEKTDSQKMGKVERESGQKVINEVPPSEARKEVPEPKGEREQPADPAVDESNLTPDQGQTESEGQQKAEPENVEAATKQGQHASEKQTQQPKAETSEEPASSEAASREQPESQAATEEAKSESKSEAQAETKPEPETETSKSKPESQPEAEAGSQSEASKNPESQKENPESQSTSGKEETESKSEYKSETEKAAKPKSEQNQESESSKQEPAADTKQESASEEAKAQANSAAESTDEESTVKAGEQSLKEDAGVKVDNHDQPIAEPETPAKPQDEKIVQKDEL